MADYHSVLSRAVSSLPENTAAGRRAIYDKARNALVRQLETIQPPLPPAEIAKQRLALEEAVRRIEGETARAALTVGRPTAPPRAEPRAPAPPPPPARQDPPRQDPPRQDPSTPRSEPRSEPPLRAEVLAPAAARTETARTEGSRPLPSRPEPPRQDPGRPDPGRVESRRPDPPRREPSRGEPDVASPPAAGATAPDAARPDLPRQEPPRLDAARAEAPRPANLGRPIEPAIDTPAAGPLAVEETDRREPPALGRNPIPRTEAERADDVRPSPMGRAVAPSIEPVVPPGAPDEPVDPAEDLFAPTPEPERKGRKRRGLFGKADPKPAAEGDEGSDSDDAAEGGRRGRGKRRKMKPANDLSDSPFDENGEWAAASNVEPRPAVRRRSRRRGSPVPLIAGAVALLLVVGVVAAAYVYRDAILEMVDAQLAETPATAPPEDEAPEEIAPKGTDRLPAANPPSTAVPTGQAPASTAPAEQPPAVEGAGDGSRSVPTTRVVTPQEPGTEAAPSTDDPSATPAAPDAAAPGAAPADGAAAPATSPPSTASAASGMTGPSRSILYEEGEVPGTKGAALNGTAKWEMVSESIGGGAPEPIVRASIEVPDRSVTTTIIMRRNRDEALPASHLIEVAFELPVNFQAGGITNLPGMIMKTTEAARGDALIGASARVSDGLFWIALSSSENDQKINLGLLRDRGWIDLPILYNNGRRAILTLEKGSEGANAINAAIDAWAKEN